MVDEQPPPPSFEPGTGRRIEPSGKPASAGKPAARPQTPREVVGGPAEPPHDAARPIPVRRPIAGGQKPSAPAPGPAAPSRTDASVDATRAVPVQVTATSGSSARPPAERSAPAGRPPTAPGRRPARPSRATYRRRRIVLLLAFVLVILVAWPVGLVIWANGRLTHVDALSGAPDTPGTTYLIAGSDSRVDGAIDDTTTEGQRTDTIMLLTAPRSGTPSLVSLPRDTYVEVPGYGPAKLNAAYAYGGPELLVQTVEQLTGITVDHYVEVGMGGVISVVDAVGGIDLCWDADVNDTDSGMIWTAGCHPVDGTQALAFARMRKSDPTGDIGRGHRQQLVIQGVMTKLKGPALLSPGRQVTLARAATDNLVTDPGTGAIALARMALTFRSATGPGGYQGAPPIASPDYRPGNLGSTVLLDEAAAPVFWQQVLDGTLQRQGDEG